MGEALRPASPIERAESLQFADHLGTGFLELRCPQGLAAMPRGGDVSIEEADSHANASEVLLSTSE